MRKESRLLTAVPPAPVRDLGELHAVAFDSTQRASARYGTLAERTDQDFRPVRDVFERLATRERARAADLTAACVAACGKPPDLARLRWAPVDLVPASEISDIGDSGLSTPYTAWALAASHRQRAFVFWTYVIALAEDPEVRRTAEGFAREALSDGNLLRQERRQAWRAERRLAAENASANHGELEPNSAALLESLLLKDLMAWSQSLDATQRQQLLSLDPAPLPPVFPATAEQTTPGAGGGEIDQIKHRALRRAEQLSNLYLDDADRATDQSSMELAQKLAAQSIQRLAGLRQLASRTELR
jgi:hypothetical protein